MYCRSHTVCDFSALDYLNLDPCSVSTVMLSVCGDLFSLLDEEKVKCFVEDVADVSASGRSVGQVQCKRYG